MASGRLEGLFPEESSSAESGGRMRCQDVRAKPPCLGRVSNLDHGAQDFFETPLRRLCIRAGPPVLTPLRSANPCPTSSIPRQEDGDAPLQGLRESVRGRSATGGEEPFKGRLRHKCAMF